MVSWNKQLINASREGDLDRLKETIEHGADIHSMTDLPLRYSAYHGHLNIVKYAIENGADIHANDDEALKYSAENGYLDIVKYLVEQGANIQVILEDENFDIFYKIKIAEYYHSLPGNQRVRKFKDLLT